MTIFDIAGLILLSITQAGLGVIAHQDYIKGDYWWFALMILCIAFLNWLMIEEAIKRGRESKKEGVWVK